MDNLIKKNIEIIPPTGVMRVKSFIKEKGLFNTPYKYQQYDFHQKMGGFVDIHKNREIFQKDMPLSEFRKIVNEISTDGREHPVMNAFLQGDKVVLHILRTRGEKGIKTTYKIKKSKFVYKTGLPMVIK